MNKYVRKLFGVMFQGPQRQQVFAVPPQHSPTSPEEWRAYWQAKGFPWRTEPEIDEKRQRELSQRRAIVPDIKQGIYPFKGMKLSRADVEWLLATHENGRGPVDWSDESQHERKGLDLRGADLSHANLYNLPLTGLQGSLTSQEWIMAPAEQREMAVIHLEEALLARISLEEAELRGAHMERADVRYAHLEGARLIEAHLEEADLQETHLERAGLYGAHLEQALLRRAHLEGAFLGRTPPEGKPPLDRLILRGPMVGPFMRHVATLPGGANLSEADLSEAHAEGAELWDANLEGAKLWKTHLEGARLIHARMARTLLQGAILAGADLTDAHLEGADLRWGYFEGRGVSREDRERIHVWVPAFPERLQAANLQYAWFDDSTLLEGAVFGKKKEGCVQFVGVRWGNADLSFVDWKSIDKLGDEYKARQRTTPEGNVKTTETCLVEYQRAVRANRQLSMALQTQGLNEEAAHFAYRAHVLQRAVFRLQFMQPRVNPGQWLRACFSWLFSLFLALIAGYGYRPGRSVLAYLIIIFGFLGLYLVTSLLGGPHLRWDEALVLSVSSFHGRGFFSQSITLGDAYARIAALEAVVGLFIEISFIATFTQRFLGK